MREEMRGVLFILAGVEALTRVLRGSSAGPARAASFSTVATCWAAVTSGELHALAPILAMKCHESYGGKISGPV